MRIQTPSTAPDFEDEIDRLVAVVRGWGITDEARQQLVFRLARVQHWEIPAVPPPPTEISDSEDDFSEADFSTATGDATLNADTPQPIILAEPQPVDSPVPLPPSAVDAVVPSPLPVALGDHSVKSTSVTNPTVSAVTTSAGTSSAAAIAAAGHHQVVYHGTACWVPDNHVTGPFYLVTRGRWVGIFSPWSKTSPYVTGVSGAVFHRIKELETGIQQLFDTIDDGQVGVVP
ncbi:hypothetical protein CONPUDRAFT_153860 [Coniophora puteana RWD-64-598 SS2]|uniref:Ribonuclease H1 N-terminal domain-containing protein n=1 Tax=Coniophora puteana (strain RWD-64-598) TaxID=741705 RepID=A0A5M3MQG2_CONPW|nr:uncharacterized protein CONPUDRAFT_153860 [Coniophora puteana RWD-64-598 SS2]EIW81310.1 hypothetical protein CONPUDRAFT_153860 [Coniophora puteana RWD-64-598 SS2]